MKYLTAYGIALQQVMQRRASLAMDRVGGLAVLVSLYYFWSALLRGRTEFLGYTGAQMLTYVLVMNVLRAFVLSSRGWELVQEISSGRVSSYLVRPLSYYGYNLALDLAQKTVHMGSALVEVAALVVAIGAPLYVPRAASTWLLFGASVAVSSLIFFALEFIVATLAFWTSESGGPLYCFTLLLEFCSGSFFPLDVLPRLARRALDLTPFPYMVFFPINIYLERPAAPAGRVLLVELAWLAVLTWAAGALWRRALDSYGAEGG